MEHVDRIELRIMKLYTTMLDYPIVISTVDVANVA